MTENRLSHKNSDSPAEESLLTMVSNSFNQMTGVYRREIREPHIPTLESKRP